MQSKIERCPCCNGNIATGDNWLCGGGYVRCVSCGLLMSAKTIEEAIEKWNCRYDDDQCGYYEVSSGNEVN